MKKSIYSVAEVSEKIKAGQWLMLSGTQQVLSQLPEGNWIGGTTPYFMTDKGGVKDTEQIFVQEIPSYALAVKKSIYSAESIKDIYNDAFDHGYTIIILPSVTPVYFNFAIGSYNFDKFATKPLAGWVASTTMEDFGKVPTAVFCGSGKAILDQAVAVHVELPANKMAEVSVINLFKQADGPVIEFENTSYDCSTAIIDGQKCSFADYLVSQNYDGTVPLVADYYGTSINVCLDVKPAAKTVHSVAPVFKGIKYRFGKKVADYVKEFTALIPDNANSDRVFSCNCLLNYYLCHLEGKKTGSYVGPFAAGEIAYQLVNQTMVNIDVVDC